MNMDTNMLLKKRDLMFPKVQTVGWAGIVAYCR